MKSLFKSLKLLIVVLVAWGFSLGLRYQHFDPPSLNQWGFGSDASSYWDLSGNLLSGRGFSDSPGMGHVFSYYPNSNYSPNVARLPAYPMALSLFRLFWNSIEIAYLLNLICYCMVIFYGVYFTRTVLDHANPVIYSILLAFSPVYLIYLQGVQSDLFAGSMTIGFVYHLYKAQDSGAGWRWLHLIGAATFGSAAILSRPNLLTFIIPLLLLEIIPFIVRRTTPLNLLVIGGAICLVVGGWGTRNKLVSGHFSLSNQLGHNPFLNYVYYNAEPGDNFFIWKDQGRTDFMREAVENGFSPTYAEFELDKRLQVVVRDYARQNPKKFTWTAAKAVSGLFLDSYFDIADIIISKLFKAPLEDNHDVRAPEVQSILLVARKLSKTYRFILLASFFIYPIVLFWTNLMKFELISIWISCVLFAAITGLVINSGDRLLLPVFPFIILTLYQTILLVFSWSKNLLQPFFKI